MVKVSTRNGKRSVHGAQDLHYICTSGVCPHTLYSQNVMNDFPRSGGAHLKRSAAYPKRFGQAIRNKHQRFLKEIWGAGVTIQRRIILRQALQSIKNITVRTIEIIQIDRYRLTVDVSCPNPSISSTMVKPSSGAQDHKFPDLQEPDAKQAGSFKIRPCNSPGYNIQDGSLLGIIYLAFRLQEGYIQQSSVHELGHASPCPFDPKKT